MKGTFTLLLCLPFLDLLAARIRRVTEEHAHCSKSLTVSAVRDGIHDPGHGEWNDDRTLKAQPLSNPSCLSSIPPPSKDSSSCKTLPSMSSRGLIFFLHIPKTGGTTIRLNLEKFDDRIQYVFAKNYSTYLDTAPKVEDVILHGTIDGRVLVYEIHATTAPSFYQLRNRLRRWKETAARNNVPVFFFTVLRESVSFAISHFSFFHLQKRNPTFERCNATEANFLRLSLYNPQCQFLFKGEASLRAQKPTQKVVRPEDCQDVQDHMLEIFDWIGSTETLSNETLPLLSRLLDLPGTYVWQNHRISKDAKEWEYFGRENISSSALEVICDTSIMDSTLHRIATDRYRYELISVE